ncbi:hypothetical protein [Actinomadura sp. 6N118]|uniref:hypothetical protein n=1 Tax=Actinomadura sp. 6N118 TaxID=3375151 RepID=UPI0037BC724E
MTTTLEPTVSTVTLPSPRVLLDYAPGLFDNLAAYVAKHHAVTLPYAEQIIEQTLIWFKACADNPSQRVGMTDAVDHGWHAFILHSQEYTTFCERTFGHYLHHVPPAPGQHMTEQEIAATLPALHDTGYAADEAFWDGPGYGCCPPDPCTRYVDPTRRQTQPTQPTQTGTPRASVSTSA